MYTITKEWILSCMEEFIPRNVESKRKYSLCVQVRRDAGSGGSEETSPKSFHMSAREYVESLHQNSKLTLLYGKNNVLVQPVSVAAYCQLQAACLLCLYCY